MKKTSNVILVSPDRLTSSYCDLIVDMNSKKEKISQRADMLYTVRPLHLLLRAFAMSRLPYSSRAVKRFHCFATITVLIATVLWTLRSRTEFVNPRLNNIMIVTDTVALSTLTVMSLGNLLVVGFQSPFVQTTIYENFSKLDKLLDIDTDEKYTKGRFVVIRAIISILTPLILISCYQGYSYVQIYGSDFCMPYIANYVLYAVNSLVSIQFVMAMYSVRLNFLIFNIQLQMFTERKLNLYSDIEEIKRYYNPSVIDDIIFNIKNAIVLAKSGLKRVKLDIDRITKAFMLNCDQCDLYNRYFSAQNFLITFNGIISILKSLHMVSVHASNQESEIEENGIFLIIGSICFALFDVFILYIITESCESVIKEAKRTSLLIDSVIWNKACDHLEDFVVSSQLIARRVPKFTALGFFNMDLSLLSTISGTIVTYLIMLIQVKAY